jgi:transposase
MTEKGHSQRQIALSAKCAKSTVGEVQRRSREQGLTYLQAEGMTNDELKTLLYPASFGRQGVKPEPDWEEKHARLTDNENRANLQYIWEEYRSGDPEGLGYSQFCRRYEKWRVATGKEVVMVREREPGRELFVDWMGDTLYCVTDPGTGEIHKAHFFVATLGDSSYPYVEAFLDEKLDNWLLAHVHAFEWIGGVPRVIVPDNLKSAVTKPNYYDPKLNPAYWELAKHYGVAVIPARIRKPKDKGAVESSIGWLETWLLEWLRGKQFFSFEELNCAIRERLRELAVRPFQKRPGSREEVFTCVDKPALRPLPQARYEHVDWALRRVPDNYHVEYDGFYYSVPYTIHKQQVTLRASGTAVEIINDNRERVALHTRCYCGSRYVTVRGHMPKNHQYQHDRDRFDAARYRQWAVNIGEHTSAVIETMLTAQHVEETAYRSCMGVLQMTKTYGVERLEAACQKARAMNSCTYTTIKNILKNAQDTVQVPAPRKPTPVHENLRGPKSFV